MKARGATSSAVIGAIFGERNFETTAKTMTISRQGSHRKLLAEIAIMGLAQRGHVMQAERCWHMFVPEPSQANVRGRLGKPARTSWGWSAALQKLPDQAARFALVFCEKHSRI
ncbi:hypothetical protein [Bradyrhizobium tunisiense]|uniref:hypothetical protein n=1 Tax=Bradyrhizobium tunisiense TaxID=3278709 RepID=UPI0035D88160